MLVLSQKIFYNRGVMVNGNVSLILIELGIVVLGLALLDRLARRFGMSAIPLYLLVGLAFGEGGLHQFELSQGFLHVGTEIGVLLLLFTLGLEYTSEQLQRGLRSGLPDGIVDFLLSFPPGFIMGLILGWDPLAAWLLGGVTYISSSGIIAKIIDEQGWMSNGETPSVISILVFEDLVMALYLPLTIVLLAGQNLAMASVSILIALVAVGVLLFAAIHYGKVLGHLIDHASDEVVLFSILGLILVVAGIAQFLKISAPVGAFLVGVALKGPIAHRTRKVLSPLRDLFAAIFFLFFGLQINPAILPPVMLPAVGLGLVTTLTKLFSGWWSARRAGADKVGSLRAGSILATRGEFSILIAGLGMTASIEPQLGAFTAAYVLFLSILGPILAQVVKPVSIVYKKYRGRHLGNGQQPREVHHTAKH
jgi:monovalent cation:H+ antiporter-2, CPA2 family